MDTTDAAQQEIRFPAHLVVTYTVPTLTPPVRGYVDDAELVDMDQAMARIAQIRRGFTPIHNCVVRLASVTRRDQVLAEQVALARTWAGCDTAEDRAVLAPEISEFLAFNSQRRAERHATAGASGRQSLAGGRA